MKNNEKKQHPHIPAPEDRTNVTDKKDGKQDANDKERTKRHNNSPPKEAVTALCTKSSANQ